MKCLSLWQPWASLLVAGAKRVETRGRPFHYRGPLLIHAAKKWDTEQWMLCQAEPFHSALVGLGYPRQVGKPDRCLPLGCIVGRVDVVACVPTHSVAAKVQPGHPPGFFEGWIDSVLGRHLLISPTEEAFGDYGPGRFAILTENPVRFEKPIKCRGRQSLFEVDDDLVRGAK